jgi:hypothetical protein
MTNNIHKSCISIKLILIEGTPGAIGCGACRRDAPVALPFHVFWQSRRHAAYRLGIPYLLSSPCFYHPYQPVYVLTMVYLLRLLTLSLGNNKEGFI